MNFGTEENTSGHGPASTLPPGVKGWSWGAFWLTWIWGIGNGVFRAFLVWIPIIGIVMWIMLGIKGREWAWRSRRWESVEAFRKTQRTWGLVGFIIFLVTTGLIALALAIPFHVLNNSQPVQLALSTAAQNTQAQTLLGSDITRNGTIQGNIDASTGSGTAQVTIPVEGSSASGSLSLNACESANQWYITQLTLSVNNKNVDLTPSGNAPCNSD